LVLVSLAIITACGGADTDLEVSDPRIGMPTGPHSALYFTVVNHSDGADVLEGASTEVAESVEIHETIMNDDGTMGMQTIDAPLEVTAGGSLVLEPGGLHLMLIDVDRLEVGEKVMVTLNWQVAGEMEIEAEVVEPDETMGHESQDG
jgi:copper(I)-binding protein